ncbi:MAG: LysR family glycine cleavage system transcriptional activator [Alphaproteobacteria bacterium]|jgi:LysR family glycine cleavage system transcriptional activator
MAKKLPPLHLLHLFEAAGRNLSFKKAAEELFLTPSAISHQIKALEAYLEITLFTRQARGVKLTQAGTSYLAVIQEVFEKLAQGTVQLKHTYSSQSLRIATFSSLASNIIIPRLGLFQRAFPEIELNIETSTELLDLRYDEFDIALRLGKGVWPGVISEKIFDLHVSPMCSPAFAQKHKLTNVSQIPRVPLIKLSTIEDAWSTWAKIVGLTGLELHSSLSLGSYDAVIQAAQQGLGLALGALPLENPALSNGQLVKPFKEQIQFEQSCYAVYLPQDKQRQDISVFLRWFKQQVESPAAL